MNRIQGLVLISWSLGLFLLGNTIQAQGRQVELIKDDGTVLEGYAKFYTGSFSYRPNKDESFKRFKMTDFETIRIFSDDEDTKTYKKIEVDDGKKPKMLVQIVEGPVTLYLEENEFYSSGYGAGLGVNGNAGQSFGSTSYSFSRLYLKRDNNKKATHIGSASKKNFKTSIANYFSDCPDLVKKINEDEYSKKEMKDIVEFYNSHCR